MMIEKYIEVLCVGGPMHGEWTSIPEFNPNLPSQGDMQIKTEVHDLGYQTTVYTREKCEMSDAGGKPTYVLVAHQRGYPELEIIHQGQASAIAWPNTHKTFALGDLVEKRRGSSWHGSVVGWYSTSLTPEGYAVESINEPGSVQIYPAAALQMWNPNLYEPDLECFRGEDPMT